MTASSNVIVTITGPSGSGKTVLSHLLREQGMKDMVSTTTRTPRQGEVDGKDYHFVTREQFNIALAEGKFMENIEYNGVLYGVSLEEAHAAFEENRPAVVVAEPHGVEQIFKCSHERGWECFRVFVDNPSDLLVGRLFNRFLVDAGYPSMADEQVVTLQPWISQALDLAGNNPSGVRMQELLRSFLHVQGASDTAIAGNQSQIEAAAKRLQSFYYEQENWVKPALDPERKLYDYITPSFNQDVQQNILDDVLWQVQQLQHAAENKSKKGRQP